MKRLFSLLTVLVLAFALAVPVGATGGNFFYGDLELPAIPTDDGYPMSMVYLGSVTDYYFAVNAVSDGVVLDDGGLYGKFIRAEKYKCYMLRDGMWELFNASDEPVTFYLGNMRNEIPLWSNIDLSENGSVFFKGTSAVPAFCDGSSCPATDVNFDDICDDCGAPLAYNLRVTPNEFNIVVKHSEDMTLRYSFTETLAGTTFDAVYSDERIMVTFDNAVNHKQYRMVDGEWVDHASYPNIYGSHAISLSGDASILSSDLDIYDENGDLFFRNPLWMEMGMVTQGEMMELLREVAGTMKILTVCGVGCLALLIGLNLFGKRLLMFLR